MKCPNCRDVTLVMAERQGVEIDYCPQCRGVWLDRGELDKLIERGAFTQQPSTPAQPQGYAQHIAPPQAPPQQPGYRPGLFEGQPQQQHHHHQQPPYPPPQQPQRYGDDAYYHQRKRKKSWLSEIFDD